MVASVAIFFVLSLPDVGVSGCQCTLLMLILVRIQIGNTSVVKGFDTRDALA